MMEVEVVDIRKASGEGKLRAFADVKFGGSLIVKGFCVLEGVKGAFVRVPSKSTKDGRWLDTIAVDDFLKPEVETKVMEAYEREVDGVDS